jgi:hypothetical protein
MISPTARVADSSSADVEQDFVDRLRPLFEQPLASGDRFAVNAAGMA